MGVEQDDEQQEPAEQPEVGGEETTEADLGAAGDVDPEARTWATSREETSAGEWVDLDGGIDTLPIEDTGPAYDIDDADEGYLHDGAVLATATPEDRERAVAAAARSVQRGGLVVIPTDTVYGIAADAFDAGAVADLLDAKGRGREMPPPVLISAATTIDALVVALPGYARALVEEFWPGPLTLVCRQQPSLQWDLGDTMGTVAVRMPDHELALEILERTGPLAVSSANLSGQPAATSALEAVRMLGDDVHVIVDAGDSPGGKASTIIDVTGPQGRVLRRGALSMETLNAVLAPRGTALIDPDAPDTPATSDQTAEDEDEDEEL